MNGDKLTLRPEGTAGAVRAVIEHNLVYEGPKRLWYTGPMFRHERPQRGRYRQFYQFGCEAVGFNGPDVDAELIMLCRRLWDDLGLENIRLELNSIGDAEERARHRVDLIAYLEKHEEHPRRRSQAPPAHQPAAHPRHQESGDAGNGQRRAQAAGLPGRGIAGALQRRAQDPRPQQHPVRDQSRLVRGLDYYNRTVFEWVTDALGSQGTVCAGGRYDPLIASFGGKPTPAVGFAMGIERLLELMKEAGEPAAPNQCDVYLVHQGEAAQLQAFVLGERLRDAGLDVVMHASTAAGPGSFKTQMKKADGSGASFAVIIGEDEVANHTASVKAMRAEEGEQQQSTVPFDDVVDFVVDQITGSGDHHHHVHDEHCNH
jgi:histidyl-tRNA synthetase